MKILIICCVLFLFSCSDKIKEQPINPQIQIVSVTTSPFKSSKRGLFAVNKNTIWCSGQGGEIGLTTDNETWINSKDSLFTNLDFRDIHAFSADKAIIMSSGNGCELYKTVDGAKSWKLVYENNDSLVFFDGMDFWDDQNGIAFSDPINKQLFIINTTDGGDSWKELAPINLPNVLLGEAGFAASGTGIVCVGDSTVYIGTGGGNVSRVFISHNRGLNWTVVETPMLKGEASGIYSMVFMDKLNGVVVGGNYLDSTNTNGNCAITADGGLTWQLPQTSPKGYQSCVADNGNGVLVATGRNGVDVSYDKGNNWEHISDDAYYSCVLNVNSGWLIGRSGKLAKILID